MDTAGHDPDEDWAALKSLHTGDAAPFSDLARRHAPNLVRYLAGRVGAADTAEDLAQEVFLNVVRTVRQNGPLAFSGRSSVRTWLFSIAGNLATDHLRRLGRARKRTPSPRDDIDRPLERAMATEELERIETLLRQLPPEQAECVRLRALGDLTVPEIAEATGVSLATTKSRLRYGLGKLKEILETPREVDHD